MSFVLILQNFGKLISQRFLCLLRWNGSVLLLLVPDTSSTVPFHRLSWLCHFTNFANHNFPSFYSFPTSSSSSFFSLFCLVSFANETSDVEWQMVAICSVIIVKFWLAITFFVINLQSMETYPTCLRQTGLSIGTIGSNIIGIFGPYIVYLVSLVFILFLKCTTLCCFTWKNKACFGQTSGRAIGMAVQLKVSGHETRVSVKIF